MAKRRRRRKKSVGKKLANIWAGWDMVEEADLFETLEHHTRILTDESAPYPREGWAKVTADGRIFLNPEQLAEPDEWAYVIAHCLLHLGMEHFQEREQQRAWDLACDCVVHHFLGLLKFGRPPNALLHLPVVPSGQLPGTTEEGLYQHFRDCGVPDNLPSFTVTGTHASDMLPETAAPRLIGWADDPPRWKEWFGVGLSQAVSASVKIAAGVESPRNEWRETKSEAQRARDWFLASYPLLGALAASFDIIEDPVLCRRLDISTAAVNAYVQEIYINPAAGLNQDECRFVMAHELLHVALGHQERCQGREHELWNIACDFAINLWLVEMGVGAMPQGGLLYDPELKGLSAESIYDRIVTDMRRYRKLATLRGRGLCDMLGKGEPAWKNNRPACDLDDFYRNCLARGIVYHYDQNRGLLPAGLEEEIRARMQPPIPWDVELAQWFDQHFHEVEKRRTYARPSRRQASTPDIPRPRCTPLDDDQDGRTFGVLLDTSGSMDRVLLGEALGAIASYAISREVPAVRVVFCDAVAYDAGYMPAEAITDRVKVRGRGGTVLQPGIELLERAADFPKTGPLLIITDGYCDRFRTNRSHAILLPKGYTLPFVPRGKVFFLTE